MTPVTRSASPVPVSLVSGTPENGEKPCEAGQRRLCSRRSTTLSGLNGLPRQDLQSPFAIHTSRPESSKGTGPSHSAFATLLPPTNSDDQDRERRQCCIAPKDPQGVFQIAHYH
jgi:hypothetical protein